MRTSRARRVLIVALLAALLAASCGDGDGDGDTASPFGEDEEQEQDADDDFSQLLSAAENESFKVTYRFDTEGSVEELTFAQDPPRQAVISDDGMFIDTGEALIVCDGTGADARCTQLPTDGALAGGSGFLAGAFAAPLLIYRTLLDEDVPGVDTDASEREIAGRAAQCATIDLSAFAAVAGADAAAAAEAEICVDAETGVLLSYRVGGDDGAEEVLEAIEVTEPDDADFEPPSDPVEVPGAGSPPGG